MLTEGLNQRHFPGLKFSLQKLKRNWCNIVVLIQSKLVLELPPLVNSGSNHMLLVLNVSLMLSFMLTLFFPFIFCWLNKLTVAFMMNVLCHGICIVHVVFRYALG
ncbi:hypothetical protein S83_030371 [Arachis hypogaea]